MMFSHVILTLAFAIFSFYCVAEQGITPIGPFSQGMHENWQTKEFDEHTTYEIIFDKSLNKTVLKANSQQSASGLFFSQKIDLEKTPWINWSWATQKGYDNPIERKKQGDDFVARLYLIIDGGLFFWNTRALNYVWSSSNEVGQSWLNPYTSNNMMKVVETGQVGFGLWQYYSRNVLDDINTLIGTEIRYIDAVAVMTDSDDTKQRALTYYGDIFFSASRAFELK